MSSIPSTDDLAGGRQSGVAFSTVAERAVDVGSECHPYCHKSYDAMQITVQVPDDLEAELKERTNDVSAYVLDALAEKLRRERRRAAREEILEKAQEGGTPADDIYDINQRERREGDRMFSPSDADPSTGGESE